MGHPNGVAKVFIRYGRVSISAFYYSQRMLGEVGRRARKETWAARI